MVRFIDEHREKFGVEPSVDAARIARGRDVRILGPALGPDVPSGRFHAALAIDVLEHVTAPRPLFDEVSRILVPGGLFLILTGNTAAWSWRLHGSRYWYCSIPEHVSFYSAGALDHASHLRGMRTVQVSQLSHARAGWNRRVQETAKNVGYGLAQRLGWLPSSVLRRTVLERRAPGWLTARDHILCVMRLQATRLSPSDRGHVADLPTPGNRVRNS